MKKTLNLLFLLALAQNIWALSAVEIVQEFGDNLSNWCKTKNSKYKRKVESLMTTEKTPRVSDRILKENITENWDHIGFENYMQLISNKIDEGLSVTYSNIKADFSPFFSGSIFANSNAPECVSCDIHVDGAMKYNIKDIFYIRNNKIVAIADYNDDMMFNKAMLLCRQKKYQDALDIFDHIMHDSKDWQEREQAIDFAMSITVKKKSKLDLGNHAIKYKIARYYYKNTDGYDIGEHPLPLLDDDNYDVALRESYYTQRIKGKNVQLPIHLYETLPYWTSWLTKEYFRHVYINSRPIEQRRFAFRKKELWGFKDKHDKTVIQARYKFAYPFDEKTGLALVQHANGKWGYIDMQGKHLPQRYDVACDVFRNGKTYVITGNTLQLIDVNGRVLQSFKGYVDIGHPLKEDQILAVQETNGDEKYVLMDFDGNTEKTLRAANPLVKKYRDCGGCSLQYGGRKYNSK